MLIGLSACVRCRALPGVKLPRVAEPTGEAYNQAVSILLPYLLSHRSRLAAFTAATAQAADPSSTATAGQAASTAGSRQPSAQQATTRSEFDEVSEAAAPGGSYSEGIEVTHVPGSPVRSQPQEFLAGLQPEQRHRLAVLVDTAILKVCSAYTKLQMCTHSDTVCRRWL